MKVIGSLCLAGSLSSRLPADTIIIDHNDTNAGGGGTVASAIVDGGIASDGASFLSSYEAVTSLVDFYPGDLNVSVPGYTVSQNPVLFDGPWHVGFNDSQGRGRFQHRDVADFAVGTTWISFFVMIEPDVDGDGEGPAFGGITLGNGGFSSSASAIPSTTTGTFLGMTYIPAGFAGAGTYLEYSHAGLPDLDGLTGTGTQANRGARSVDLGLLTNTTYLVIAKLDQGSNVLSAWINPSEVTSEVALGAPDLSTPLGISQITRVGFGGDADGAGSAIHEHVECRIDAIRLSNSPSAFQVVTTGTEPTLEIDPGTEAFDFVFGTIIGGSDTQTVTFSNLSPVQGETITVESVMVTDSAGGVFGVGTLPSLPVVLSHGDTIAVQLTASSPVSGSFAGEVTIDTTSTGTIGADVNDQVLPLSAEFFAPSDPVYGAADLNGNGMPDLAELLYPSTSGLPPGTDSDDDGVTDLDEAKAGTNPLDPQSYLRVVEFEESPTVAEMYEFTFTSEARRLYAIESSPNLEDWSQSGGLVLATGGTTTVMIDQADLPAGHGFLRAGVLQAVDGDGDGLEDPLELYLGFDPGEASSVRSATNGGDLVQFLSMVLGGNASGGVFGTMEAGVPSDEQASRFLAQATFGPTAAKIADLRALGPNCYELWIDQQLAEPANYLRSYIDVLVARMASDAAAPDYDVFPHYVTESTSFAMYRENVNTVWMRQALFADDELRQRVAWALSQIVVIGPRCNSYGIAAADWYDTVLEHSLGNYRDLLYDIAVHPWMGWYLSHIGNRKADPTISLLPDENFAREIMQLFSIGLIQLNMDGTPVLDPDGDPVETYTNDDIAQLARVFTGLNLQLGTSGQGAYAVAPMRMVEADHDTGDAVSASVYGAREKLFLGASLPAFADDPGRTGLDDVSDAVDVLFNHPNCPPFVSRNLIQHLVTSNPSPAYVERVANVFVNDGTGVRGNMAAVVKAILMDSEARDLPARLDPVSGRLKGPMLRMVMMARAFGAGAETPNLHDLTGIQFWSPGKKPLFSDFLEHPFEYPSVFNFYEPSYSRPGEVSDLDLRSPEFQIMNPLTATTTPNRFWAMIDDGIHTAKPAVTPAFRLNLERLRTPSFDTDLLLDRLNVLLCHGSLSPAGRAEMKAYIDYHAATDPNWVDRAELAIFLALVSPDGAVLD